MRPLLLALVLCLAAAPAAAATYSSLAAADGHVSGPKDGSYTTLDTELFVALTLYGSWTTMRESLFEYDISSIPAGATLTGATWQIQTSSENGVFQVNGYVADGVLELADAPAPEDSVAVFYGGTFGIRQVPLDLARIQALVDAGSGYLGLAVRGEPDTTSSVQISTKEISSAGARAARLILDYQEPTDAPPAGRFALEGAAPNPFNPATVLRYATDAEGPVRLRLYDTRGRKVRTLVERIQSAGRHRVRWDGADDAGRAVPSGVYLAVLSDGVGRRSVGKLVLAR